MPNELNLFLKIKTIILRNYNYLNDSLQVFWVPEQKNKIKNIKFNTVTKMKGSCKNEYKK